MKNKSLIFIVACMALCLIPSVGMLFFPTTKTTENRAMAEVPKFITEDGKPNSEFFRDFDTYFNEHIALRNQMVYADAKIQTSLFQVSNVDSIIDGTDGWLYYSDTLEDYLGSDVLSERELFNLAHNFSIVEKYLEDRGIDFLLTVPPNKNSLYGENMPYYASYIVDEAHSVEKLKPFLKAQDVTYLDLFVLFGKQDQVLYLRRDSHWNGKGAYLAYQAIMDSLKRKHTVYNLAEPVETARGDLNQMLYSFYGQTEEDYGFKMAQAYTYQDGTGNVEDGWIVTQNPKGEGTLLMFRDSFANTLIPFLSNAFETAAYAKGFPNALEKYVQIYNPDCVVIEKVERNITDYLMDPPILTPLETEIPSKITIADTDSSVSVKTCANDIDYYAVTGTVDPERLAEDAQIVVSIADRAYPAYHTGACDYTLYLKKMELPETSATIRVYAVYDDSCAQVLMETFDLSKK